MSGLRIGNSVHPVKTSDTGFTKSEGKKIEKFANIFSDLSIPFSTENTKLCKEEGVVVKKELQDRDIKDSTSNPPFGKTIPGPFIF